MTAKELIVRLQDYPLNAEINMEDISQIFTGKEEHKLKERWLIRVTYYEGGPRKSAEKYSRTEPTKQDILDYVKILPNKQEICKITVEKYYII